jgi:predicted transcriptional regulator of viral defense system
MAAYIPPASQHLEQLFAAHGGILNMQQVRGAGVDPRVLLRWVEQGKVERLSRGVYQALEQPPHPYAAMLEVQLRIPYAVLCLLSALSFHQLTTIKPPQLYFAIPHNRAFPPLEYPPLERFYFSAAVYAFGQETHTLEGQTLRVYSAEKTLADVLKYASRLGKDLFIEGLHTYLKRPQPNLKGLLEAARVCKVEPQMRDALELLSLSIQS